MAVDTLAPANDRLLPEARRNIAVKIAGLSHYFELAGSRLKVLAGIDLDVAPGEFVALLGPSGCGKSTLLRLIAGYWPHRE